jgi:predicted dehydrogenase
VCSFPAIDDRPTSPVTTRYGIGLIGCGGIVNYAHLPAYTAHHLNVVACHDRNPDAAKATSDAFGIGVIHDSVDAMLADPDVAIVDIAVHPSAQPEIAIRAMQAGKHVLCQKPMALTPKDALRIVEAANVCGRKAAVNQQMRWAGGIAAAKQIISSGFVGDVTDANIIVSVETPWHMWPWLRDSDQLEIMYHSIHYQDSLRFLLGNPATVTSRHARFPDQPERAETKTLTVLDYASGAQALVAVNHHNHSKAPIAGFRFQGTMGVIAGEIGLLATYPDGAIDTVRARRNDDPVGSWNEPQLTTLWMPDAFIGPMASLINAIESDSEPSTTVADNLDTVRVVSAIYQSAATGRTVHLDEIAAN